MPCKHWSFAGELEWHTRESSTASEHADEESTHDPGPALLARGNHDAFWHSKTEQLLEQAISHSAAISHTN